MTPPPASFPIFAQLLRRHAGLKFGPEKSYLLTARLENIMRREGCETLDALAEKLTRAPNQRLLERDIFEAMLNHESFFFRDGLPFTELETQIYPALRDARRASRRLAIWSAACAGGQEPYSLAMQLAEQRDEWQGWTIDLLASDVSYAALARAKTGAYSQFEVQRGLSTPRLLQYFEKSGEKWCVADTLRRTIRFEQRNLTLPPPQARNVSGRFDVIFARNVLMYLAPEEKVRAIHTLRNALADDGVLVLGAAETLFGHSDLFVAQSCCRGYYGPAHKDRGATMADPVLCNRQTGGHPSATSRSGHPAAR